MRIVKHTAAQVEHKIRHQSVSLRLPFIASRLIELVENPKTSASTLAKLIAMDQSLALRVLRLANSNFFRYPRKISSISQALTTLGFKTIRNLVLAITVAELFEETVLNGIEPGQFWKHALSVAICAHAIGQHLKHPAIDEAFISGLLHEAGLLVLGQEFPNIYADTTRDMRDRQCTFDEALNHLYKFSRYDVCAWLVDSWKLPQQCVQAIRYHQMPLRDPSAASVASMIHVADQFCNTIPEAGWPLDSDKSDNSRMTDSIRLLLHDDKSPGFYSSLFFDELHARSEMLSVLLEAKTIDQDRHATILS